MVRPGAPHSAALASVTAVLALAGAAAASDGTTTPATTTTAAAAPTTTVAAPPPCVVAGAVAIVRPNAASVTFVGPSVSASEVTSVDVPSFADATVQLGRTQIGAAGCDAAGGPGGASTRIGPWSLFGGAIRGSSLRADLVPSASGGDGWYVRRKLTALEVAGAPLDPVPGTSAAVGAWGTLDVGGRFDGKTIAPLRWWSAALVLHVVRAHAGLPAGTLVLIGYAGAAARPLAPPAPPEPATTETATVPAATTTAAPAATTTAAAVPATTVAAGPKPAPAAPAAKKPTPKPLGGRPLKGTPPLGQGAYVFPVDGRADWGDSYGGERSDVPGGWHHGDDLFAPLGTPVVAVADGTVFAVGWNRVGGWRLWLLDANGNEFYYAHLSGYTGNARNGAEVRKGEVLGFVGNTGDAVTTWPHLHFEVHPSSTLFLGYDGAVDPTVYLRAFPLAHNVVVPPPVELPSAAPPGRGSAADFRKLLAVHPLRKPVRAKPAPAPSFHPEGFTLGPVEGAGSVSAAPPLAVRPAAGGGDAALVVGILLLLAGAGAVAYTARAGRSTAP